MQIVQLTFFNIYPVTIIYSLDRETKSKPTNRKKTMYNLSFIAKFIVVWMSSSFNCDDNVSLCSM